MSDLSKLSTATWADLTEPQPEHTKTLLERRVMETRFGGQFDIDRWLSEGVMQLDLSQDQEFMGLLDAYAKERSELPRDRNMRTNYWNGWHFPTSYLVSQSMLAVGLSRQLVEPLNVLFNENALLHLALTGWVSTERNWHQDSYLNPPNVWSSYAAVWIPLDDIDEDAGPFEYVPGSHRWEVLRRERLFNFLDPSVRSSPNWPSITQGEVARICEEQIAAKGVKPVIYAPQKGRVLIWHSNLMHRGTEPRNKDLLRKSLILHYSGVSRRTDMNPIKRHGWGFYFDGPVDGSVRMMK